MKKKYDAVVTTGTYTANGVEKKRYKNVGAVMANDDGSLFMLLEATFNPAGIKQEGKESVLISFYEPKPKDGYATHDAAEPTHAELKANGYTPETIADEIPY
jgi:hypothetical protein